MPTLAEHTVPSAPSISLPTFAGHLPSVPSAPTNITTALSTAYHTAAPEFITVVNSYVDAELAKINPAYHTQMAKIEAQLSKYLEGGTGLSTAAENAIYARARSRNDAEARRVRDQAFSDAAARGFTLPTGALMSSIRQARQAGADNNAIGAREIVVMQAEMEQKNLQFAVSTSANLRTAMINATLSYMQNIGQINAQALDYAKSVLGSIVEMYNTEVRRFSAQLEGYKAEASVHETLVRAAMAGVEIYKAEIQALQALTQVDMAKVDVYKARIDVLTSLSTMYRSQVEAAVSKASLERLKLDVFQAQVQAYGAQVQAKNSEWQGYTAQINGEQAKAQVFNTQVSAYSSQVASMSAVVNARAEAVKARATSNDAKARQYSAMMSGYQTVVQARGEVARTKLENQRQKVVAYQAEAQAEVAKAQLGMEFYKATGSISIENARLAMQSLVADAQAKTNYTHLLATLSTANAQIHGSVAGSALSGMNSLAADIASKSY